MIWTTERPTQSGYYWVEYKFGHAQYVIDIAVTIDGRLMNVENDTEINPNDIIFWAGPIPIPLPEGEINATR